ncbi:hypothetical protein ACVBEJ_04795 [Porticoccus sp. GXU_MW_L64]
MKNLLIAVVALLALNSAAFAGTDLLDSKADFEATTIGFVLNQDGLKADLKADLKKEVLKKVNTSIEDDVHWNNSVVVELDSLEAEFATTLQEQLKTSIQQSLEICCV